MKLLITLFLIGWFNILMAGDPKEQYVSRVPEIPSQQEIERRIRLMDYDKNFTINSFNKHAERKDYEVFIVSLSSLNPTTKKPMRTEFFWYRSKMTKEKDGGYFAE